MIETYEKVLNSDNSLETQKQSATDEIKKIKRHKKQYNDMRKSYTNKRL